MAATSYTNLRTAITNWLDDQTGRYTSLLDDFIDMGEARIYRELRIRAMETALNATISGGVIPVPSDYIELKQAYIDGSSVRVLERKPAEWVLRKYPKRSADAKPFFIARDAGNFIFGPFPDSVYTVIGTYYRRLPSLSSSNETNWFTDNAPDLLLFACLCEAEPFIGNDDRFPLWESRYQAAKAQIIREEKHEAMSGGPMRTVAS